MKTFFFFPLSVLFSSPPPSSSQPPISCAMSKCLASSLHTRDVLVPTISHDSETRTRNRKFLQAISRLLKAVGELSAHEKPTQCSMDSCHHGVTRRNENITWCKTKGFNPNKTTHKTETHQEKKKHYKEKKRIKKKEKGLQSSRGFFSSFTIFKIGCPCSSPGNAVCIAWRLIETF